VRDDRSITQVTLLDAGICVAWLHISLFRTRPLVDSRQLQLAADRDAHLVQAGSEAPMALCCQKGACLVAGLYEKCPSCGYLMAEL
jgi:hypothetical protein